MRLEWRSVMYLTSSFLCDWKYQINMACSMFLSGTLRHGTSPTMVTLTMSACLYKVKPKLCWLYAGLWLTNDSCHSCSLCKAFWITTMPAQRVCVLPAACSDSEVRATPVVLLPAHHSAGLCCSTATMAPTTSLEKRVSGWTLLLCTRRSAVL